LLLSLDRGMLVDLYCSCSTIFIFYIPLPRLLPVSFLPFRHQDFSKLPHLLVVGGLSSHMDYFEIAHTNSTFCSIQSAISGKVLPLSFISETVLTNSLDSIPLINSGIALNSSSGIVVKPNTPL